MTQKELFGHCSESDHVIVHQVDEADHVHIACKTNIYLITIISSIVNLTFTLIKSIAFSQSTNLVLFFIFHESQAFKSNNSAKNLFPLVIIVHVFTFELVFVIHFRIDQITVCKILSHPRTRICRQK